MICHSHSGISMVGIQQAPVVVDGVIRHVAGSLQCCGSLGCSRPEGGFRDAIALRNLIPASRGPRFFPGRKAAKFQAAAKGQEPDTIVITIERGDALIPLARKYGVKVQDLYEANKDNLLNADHIEEGRVLRVPKGKRLVQQGGQVSRNSSLPPPAAKAPLPSATSTGAKGSPSQQAGTPGLSQNVEDKINLPILPSLEAAFAGPRGLAVLLAGGALVIAAIFSVAKGSPSSAGANTVPKVSPASASSPPPTKAGNVKKGNAGGSPSKPVPSLAHKSSLPALPQPTPSIAAIAATSAASAATSAAASASVANGRSKGEAAAGNVAAPVKLAAQEVKAVPHKATEPAVPVAKAGADEKKEEAVASPAEPTPKQEAPEKARAAAAEDVLGRVKAVKPFFPTDVQETRQVAEAGSAKAASDEVAARVRQAPSFFGDDLKSRLQNTASFFSPNSGNGAAADAAPPPPPPPPVFAAPTGEKAKVEGAAPLRWGWGGGSKASEVTAQRALPIKTEDKPAVTPGEVVAPAGVSSSAADGGEEEDEGLMKQSREAINSAIIQALPAVAIVSGAAGVATGFENGLEVIGLMAVASFVTFDLLWADQREKLWEQIKNVKDHKQLVKFLNDRDIVKCESHDAE